MEGPPCLCCPAAPWATAALRLLKESFAPFVIVRAHSTVFVVHVRLGEGAGRARPPSPSVPRHGPVVGDSVWLCVPSPVQRAHCSVVSVQVRRLNDVCTAFECAPPLPGGGGS